MPLTIAFRFEAEPEDLPIEGNASAVDPETDRETEAWIRAELDRGNVWAWAHVVCVASVELDGETFEGRDHLGACSYRSREDFEAPDGYAPDMRKAAAEDLRATLKAAIARGALAGRVLSLLPAAP